MDKYGAIKCIKCGSTDLELAAKAEDDTITKIAAEDDDETGVVIYTCKDCGARFSI